MWCDVYLFTGFIQIPGAVHGGAVIPRVVSQDQCAPTPNAAHVLLTVIPKHTWTTKERRNWRWRIQLLQARICSAFNNHTLPPKSHGGYANRYYLPFGHSKWIGRGRHAFCIFKLLFIWINKGAHGAAKKKKVAKKRVDKKKQHLCLDSFLGLKLSLFFFNLWPVADKLVVVPACTPPRSSVTTVELPYLTQSEKIY